VSAVVAGDHSWAVRSATDGRPSARQEATLIGRISVGKRSSKTAHYLEHGKTGKEAGRIEDFFTHASPYPGDYARTADYISGLKSVRPELTYDHIHLSVSFGPDDEVTWDDMKKVGNRVIRDLELDDHPAIVVSHNDGTYRGTDVKRPHIHILASTINQETGQRWNDSFAMTRVEKSLRQLEVEMKLTRVRGYLYEVNPGERPERDRTESDGVFRRRSRQKELPFLVRAREDLRGRIGQAASYHDLETMLARNGYWLEQRPRGFVITDGEHYAAASKVDKNASQPRLEKRFGITYTAYLENPDLERVSRALEPGAEGRAGAGSDRVDSGRSGAGSDRGSGAGTPEGVGSGRGRAADAVGHDAGDIAGFDAGTRTGRTGAAAGPAAGHAERATEAGTPPESGAGAGGAPAGGGRGPDPVREGSRPDGGRGSAEVRPDIPAALGHSERPDRDQDQRDAGADRREVRPQGAVGSPGAGSLPERGAGAAGTDAPGARLGSLAPTVFASRKEAAAAYFTDPGQALERIDFVIKDAPVDALAKYLRTRTYELSEIQPDAPAAALDYLVDHAEKAALQRQHGTERPEQASPAPKNTPAEKPATARPEPKPPIRPEAPAVDAQQTLEHFNLLAEYQQATATRAQLDVEWDEVKHAHIKWSEIRKEINTTREAALEASKRYLDRKDPEGALDRLLEAAANPKKGSETFNHLKTAPSKLGISPSGAKKFYAAFYDHFEARKKVRTAAKTFRETYPALNERDNHKVVARCEKEGIELVTEIKANKKRLEHIESTADIRALREAASRLSPADRQMLKSTVGPNPERLLNQKMRKAAKAITRPGLER
jgi:hypothetical protein